MQALNNASPAHMKSRAAAAGGGAGEAHLAPGAPAASARLGSRHIPPVPTFFWRVLSYAINLEAPPKPP